MKIQPWFRPQVDIQLPRRPYPKGLLIVANHRSHLDAFIVLSRFAGIRMFAKRSLFFNPFIGPMLWAIRQIPVEQSPSGFMKALDKVGENLDQGEMVLVFPELTRCPPGHKGVQSFSASPFQVAIKRGTPILPLAFCNTDGIWPKGDLSIYPKQHVRVKTLPLIETHPEMNPLQVRNSVAAHIAAELAT